MAWTTRMAEVLHAQRGNGFLWLPIHFSMGIAGYFALKFEPSLPQIMGVIALWGILVALAYILRHSFGFVFLVAFVIISGFLWVTAKSHWVSAPIFVEKLLWTDSGSHCCH